MRDELSALAGRSVLVTGHTGFKGSWLALWLHRLGAEVTGYALDPSTTPNHFDASNIADALVEDVRGDIRDAERLEGVFRRMEPEVVFHLAAQPIVRTSLVDPRETFDVNVVGTASVLDAVREIDSPCAVVVVTSDKCYQNEGNVWGFREIDPLGGRDPYSASKAGAEMVVESYRSSFFSPNRIAEHGIRLASGRAGNVIGGGDWAPDRIVPDAMRALADGSMLMVRNPRSTRPWQHVLEPLSGYLALATKLLMDESPAKWAEAWNFGPLVDGEATVAALADALTEAWGSGSWITSPLDSDHVEAKTLRIAIDKAIALLGWEPQWDLDETVSRTVGWYKEYYEGVSASMQNRSLDDIEAYMQAAAPRRTA